MFIHKCHRRQIVRHFSILFSGSGYKLDYTKRGVFLFIQIRVHCVRTSDQINYIYIVKHGLGFEIR